MAEPGTTTPSRWQRVDELFRQAIELPLATRAAFLQTACADAPDLKREVEALLAHDAAVSQAADEFLPPVVPAGVALPVGTPVLPRAEAARNGDSPASPASDPMVGRRIGRYEVKSVIANGGMGTVYEAVQDHPHRVVALKVMNQRASPAALKRFQYEAEILGRLRHPNIAQVHEAGVHTEGEGPLAGWALPYFAMEYVPGAATLTDYATREQLPLRRRLELFAKVCDAVQHGHQQGVIHRDLKPANILVDAAGEPKVIDFGVARTTDADLALTTQHTAVGALVGTIQYMSPEQCDGDPAGVDTRSDVYSLGVVLYELLAGELPYDATTGTIYTAARVVKEQPPRGLSAINRRLRGDVETIVLKTLEKDRERRYTSAADLAQDIRRYLRGEPIEARPPTAWTQLIRWSTRHPYAVTATVCLAFAATSLAATFALVWLINARPHQFVRLQAPGFEYRIGEWQEARLLSQSGNILRSWRSNRPTGVRLAELVARPRALGGGRLAIVVAPLDYEFAQMERIMLQVFDVSEDLSHPAWRGQIERGLPLPDPHGRGYTAEQFEDTVAALADVFPEHPGIEIIASHNHCSYSQRVIRIYDLTGEVLYEVWQDGGIGSFYWMQDAGLLVMAGLNADVYWEERGYPGVDEPHPKVVFAIRPRYRYRPQAFLASEPGDGPLDPAWYLCLFPPEVVGDRKAGYELVLSRPRVGDSGRAVAVNARSGAGVGLAWDIDCHGREIPLTRVPGDDYIRALNAARERSGTALPAPPLIRLEPLPPVVSRPRQPSGTPSSTTAQGTHDSTR